jgi:hypothetical protein
MDWEIIYKAIAQRYYFLSGADFKKSQLVFYSCIAHCIQWLTQNIKSAGNKMIATLFTLSSPSLSSTVPEFFLSRLIIFFLDS